MSAWLEDFQTISELIKATTEDMYANNTSTIGLQVSMESPQVIVPRNSSNHHEIVIADLGKIQVQTI
jgi:hypothetical protein